MTEPLITCPICAGQGECEAEKRLYVRGMNRWYERGCRACLATGRTTATRLLCYHANRRSDVKELQLFRERQRRQKVA